MQAQKDLQCNFTSCLTSLLIFQCSKMQRAITSEAGRMNCVAVQQWTACRKVEQKMAVHKHIWHMPKGQFILNIVSHSKEPICTSLVGTEENYKVQYYKHLQRTTKYLYYSMLKLSKFTETTLFSHTLVCMPPLLKATQ